MHGPGEQALRANIWKFYLVRSLVEFQLLFPIWVVYLQEERGLSLQQVTAMEGPFWLATVLLEVPTGAVADRFGRKVSLSLGALVYAGAVATFGLAQDYTVLFASYLLWAGALTLFSGADAAFFYDTLKALGREEEYQRLWGRATALQAAAVAGGFVLGAPLAAATTLWMPIAVSAVIVFIAWLISLTLVEPPVHEETHREGLVATIRAAGRLAWGQPSLRYLMPLAAAAIGGVVVLQVLAQPFLRSHDIGIAYFGWLLLPGQLAGMAGALFAHRIATVLGMRNTVLLVLALALGPLALFAASSSAWVFLAFPVAAATWSTAQPVISDYVNRRVPSAQRATVLSLFQLQISVVAGLLIPLAGAAGEDGLSTGYRLTFGLTALTVAPLLLLWLRSHRPQPPVALEPVLPIGAEQTAVTERLSHP